MFGTKTYELPLNRNYVAHWGMPQAVRELIQNALDSESPFEYSFSDQDTTLDEPERQTLRLTSEFATLLPNTLLLGTTSKAGAKNKIGSFGEGYKIALLVLAREGYPVEMLNGDVRWTPSFKHSRQFEDEVLCISEEKLHAPNKGLTVNVAGLTRDDVDQIRQSCLKMQDEIGEVKETKWGRVLVGQPGKLYVGSLFICETQMKFGYDVKPEYITLERDRQTVSAWDLGTVALDMLLEAYSYEEVARMIIDGKYPDVEYARWSMPELLKHEIFKQWRENNPGKLVAQDQTELKALVAQGFKHVHVASPSVYHAVRHHPEYAQQSPKITHGDPTEMLRQWFQKHSQCLTPQATSDWANILLQSKYWEWK